MIALPLHELLLATGGRWLGLLALAVLVGGLVLDCFVLPRHAGELATARRRLQEVDQRGHRRTPRDVRDRSAGASARHEWGDLSQVGTALPLVLTRTHFGTVWIARALILAALLALSVSRSSPGRMVAFVLALGVALTGDAHRARRRLGRSLVHRAGRLAPRRRGDGMDRRAVRAGDRGQPRLGRVSGFGVLIRAALRGRPAILAARRVLPAGRRRQWRLQRVRSGADLCFAVEHDVWGGAPCSRSCSRCCSRSWAP